MEKEPDECKGHENDPATTQKINAALEEFTKVYKGYIGGCAYYTIDKKLKYAIFRPKCPIDGCHKMLSEEAVGKLVAAKGKSEKERWERQLANAKLLVPINNGPRCEECKAVCWYEMGSLVQYPENQYSLKHTKCAEEYKQKHPDQKYPPELPNYVYRCFGGELGIMCPTCYTMLRLKDILICESRTKWTCPGGHDRGQGTSWIFEAPSQEREKAIERELWNIWIREDKAPGFYCVKCRKQCDQLKVACKSCVKCGLCSRCYGSECICGTTLR